MLTELDEGMSGFHGLNPNHWGERWQGCWKNWYETVVLRKWRDKIAKSLQGHIKNCDASGRCAMRRFTASP
jgi:hypothetical protein